MANILVVSGSYYPYATANAACMKEFEKSMIAAGHKVTYIIKQHDIDTGRYTVQDGIEVYHVPRGVDNFYSTCEKLKAQPLPQPMSFLFRSGLIAIKVITKLYAKLRYGSLRQYAEEKYLDLYASNIKKLVDEKQIDVIISVSMPFLSHKAVLRYLEQSKNQTIKWFAYMIDAYSQKYNTNEVKMKISEEMDVLQRADKALLLSVLREDYAKAPFSQYGDKMCYLPIPTFSLEQREQRVDSITTSSGMINCVYAGTLYDDTSSLDFFMQFLKAAQYEKIVRFHFMGKRYSRNEGMLQQLKQNGYDMVLEGMMPSAYADESIQHADVVLNIGNLSINQIPSKIFQYMREGKPILTFYRIKNDPALPYLERYPLACNIFEEPNSLSEETIQRVREFLLNTPKMKVDMEEMIKIYAEDTSDAICAKFMEYLNELL